MVECGGGVSNCVVWWWVELDYSYWDGVLLCLLC